jgi:hypothetical protein
MRSITLLMLAAVFVAAGGGLLTASAQDSPKDDLAAQLRAQGYKCDAPQGAVQDMQASKPDEAVWVVNCEDARYRVHLVPDMAAKVERLGDNKGDNDH